MSSKFIETIRAELDLDDGAAPLDVVYGAFVAGNPKLVELARQRAVSYWNCYHRSRYSRDAYPAFAVLASLERAASRARLTSS